MALNVNTPEGYGYDVAALFGVIPSLLDTALKAGVSISPSKTNPLKFLILAGGSGEYSGAVEVKGTAMTMAKAGTMGPASKQAIGAQFSAQIAAAVAGSTTATGKVAVDPALGPDETAFYTVKGDPKTDADGYTAVKLTAKSDITIEALKKSFGAIKFGDSTKLLHGAKKGPIINPMTVASLGSPSVDPAIFASPKMALSAAELLGQPVHGTSSKSTYYVVARLDGLNVAIRSKFNKLSIRMEGHKLDTYAPNIKALGFTVHKDGYASAHYEVAENVLVAKTVGAVIGALGFENLLQALDVSKVIGK